MNNLPDKIIEDLSNVVIIIKDCWILINSKLVLEIIINLL